MKKILLIAILAISTVCMCACSKSASDYNKEGMEYYEDGDYTRALQYLQKATSEDAEDIDIRINYGMTLIQNNRAEDAISVFNECTSKKTDGDSKIRNKKSYRGLGIAYLQLKDFDNAIKYFEKALKIDVQNKWNTDIKYYEANAQRYAGNVDKALSLYTELINKNSKNAMVYIARANIYRDREDFSSALADYNSALLYCEGNFDIYIGLAACYLDSGHTEEANEALFLASLLDIKSNEDKYYLAVVHYYQGLFDSAKSEMEYALANGFEDAYFYLAEICLSQNEYDKALEYFEKYSESNIVESPTVCNDYAVCYLSMEDYEEAAKWIEKGLAFSSSGVERELKRNEIACLEGQGDYPGALEKLRGYIEEYPDDEGAKTDYEFLSKRVTG